MTLLLGAVAYDPKVVTIWSGFREWLRTRDIDMDFLLYSNYERQAEDFVAGRVDLAWHSPLAYLRSERLARAAGTTVEPVLMRDTDRDLTSAVVVPAQSELTSLAELRGRKVGVGAVDSPQSTLLPMQLFRTQGLTPGDDFTVVRHDIGVGLHGDHIGGEREAAAAMRDGLVDAACMTDANLLLFSQEGTLAPGTTKVLATTDAFDHCMMAASPRSDRDAVGGLLEALQSMSYDDPESRVLLDLEGLTRWLPPRTDRYAALDSAIDDSGFYDSRGAIIAPDYRP